MVVVFLLLHLTLTLILPLVVLLMVMEDVVNLFDWTKNAIRNYPKR